MKKKSFLMYHDTEITLDAMSDEQAGKFIKAIFDYAARGEIVETDDDVVRFCLLSARATMDRDAAKYNERCDKNKENGALGGLSKSKRMLANASECKRMLANASECKQSLALAPDNDIGIGIENEETNTRGGGPAAPIDPKAFSGFVIYHQDGEMRINNRDLESWKSAYSHLDIPAQLQSLSDWTRETREWTKKDAFHRTSATLKLRDERARILAEEKRKDEARQDKKPMTVEERKRAEWLASGQAVN